MALNASKIKSAGNGGTQQEALESGVYPARLVQVLDLGLQPQRPYQGQEKPPAPEIMLTYELVDEFMKDENGDDIEDKPRWISETVPLRSIDQDLAKSTKRYKALDPKMEFEGDFSLLLGTPCNVTLVSNPGTGKHVGKTFTNVAGIASMRPRDAQKCAELVNPAKMFDADEPDMEVFGSLPEWVQDKIKANLNFNGSPLQKALGGTPTKEAPPEEPDQDEDDDDRPF